MAGPIAKPILRAHGQAYQVRGLVFATVASFIIALGYKHLVAEPRKRSYAEFYKTYDPEEHQEQMFKWGILRTFQDQDN